MFADVLKYRMRPNKINALRTVGVPYDPGYETIANDDLLLQANGIVNDLKGEGVEILPEAEIVALIAYLQRLGTDIKVKETSDSN